MAQGEEVGKVFVGGLSWESSQDSLRQHFAKFGEVVDCVIMTDPVTQRSRGFGFVKFKDPTCVETVLSSGPHILDGRTIDPKACTPRSQQQKSRQSGGNFTGRVKKVFIGGIPPNCNEDDITKFFSQFGEVTEFIMMYDQQQKRPRGFGFLSFNNEDIVEKVCSIRYHTINGKTVECKKAEPRDARAPHPNQQHGPPMSMQGGHGGWGPGMGRGGPPHGGYNQGGWHAPPPGNYGPPPQGGYGGQQGGYGSPGGRSGGHPPPAGTPVSFGAGSYPSPPPGSFGPPPPGTYSAQPSGYGQPPTPQPQPAYGEKNKAGGGYSEKNEQGAAPAYAGYAGYATTQQQGDPYASQTGQGSYSSQPTAAGNYGNAPPSKESSAGSGTGSDYGANYGGGQYEVYNGIPSENSGTMGQSYAQEASGYGPTRVSFNGYSATHAVPQQGGSYGDSGSYGAGTAQQAYPAQSDTPQPTPAPAPAAAAAAAGSPYGPGFEQRGAIPAANHMSAAQPFHPYRR